VSSVSVIGEFARAASFFLLNSRFQNGLKNAIFYPRLDRSKIIVIIMGKKKLSGAAKRKKKKEKEEAIAEAKADLERLKLGPTKLWTGLVTHHRDIFVSHVLPKLNTTDRCLFAAANGACKDLLEYAGENVSEMSASVHECTSISTLEWAWNELNQKKRCKDKTLEAQTCFCAQVAGTNRLEFLRWAREEKKCEWNEWTIEIAQALGNLEMLKYCFANDCPYDERKACANAARKGHLNYLRFFFDKVKPSPETEMEAAQGAANYGHLDILKYFVEERKLSDDAKSSCVGCSAGSGYLDCLKYLVEEAKAPLDNWRHITLARFHQEHECEHYLRERGCPEPTEHQYAWLVEKMKELASRRR